MIRPLHCMAVAATLVAAVPLTGQTIGLYMNGPVAESDLLYFSGDPLAAYERLTERLEAEPEDFDALWRAARAAVAIGVQRDGVTEQNRFLDPAIDLGERAMAVRPHHPLGRYWRGAAAGRRALNAGPRYSAELARVAWDDAHRLLGADTLHSGAHNMLGKLHFEVMSLSRIERLLARTFMGNRALSNASWDGAERHLLRAAELEPHVVLYQLDLGLYYMKRGRDEEAIDALGKAVAAPSIQPMDPMLKEIAAETSARLGG